MGQFRIYSRLLPLIASPYLLLQDADDWSHPDRIARQLAALERQRVDVMGTAVVRELPDGRRVEMTPPEDVNRALRWRRQGGCFFGSTMLVRTEFARRLAGFDGRTRIAGDTDFICRAVFVGRVRNHPEPLYHYVDRSDSLTASAATGFGSAERKRYLRQLRRRFYANLLRRTWGGLGWNGVQAPPVDVPFDLAPLG